MSEIQVVRWSWSPYGGYKCGLPGEMQGDYIRHRDHLAVVAARDETIKKLADEILRLANELDQIDEFEEEDPSHNSCALALLDSLGIEVE